MSAEGDCLGLLSRWAESGFRTIDWLRDRSEHGSIDGHNNRSCRRLIRSPPPRKEFKHAPRNRPRPCVGRQRIQLYVRIVR